MYSSNISPKRFMKKFLLIFRFSILKPVTYFHCGPSSRTNSKSFQKYKKKLKVMLDVIRTNNSSNYELN